MYIDASLNTTLPPSRVNCNYRNLKSAVRGYLHDGSHWMQNVSSIVNDLSKICLDLERREAELKEREANLRQLECKITSLLDNRLMDRINAD